MRRTEYDNATQPLDAEVDSPRNTGEGTQHAAMGATRSGDFDDLGAADDAFDDDLDGELDGEATEEDDENGEQAGGMYVHLSLVADRGQSLLRIDKFLTQRMERVSRARIQAAAEAGSILVNDAPVRSNYKVKPLDRVQIVMPFPRREVEIIPEDIPLDIVYEDDDLLVVDKPAGMVVHPGHGNYSGTLVNALTHHLKIVPRLADAKAVDERAPLLRRAFLEDMRAGLVHRIDKNTSGLLVVAKTEQAHTRLSRQFFDHTTVRRYVALVWGNFDLDEGTITGNIGRSRHDRLKMAVFPNDPDRLGRLGPDGEPEGKHAVTHYRVLKRYGYVTLLELRLETGRTHQIRVHMEWTGHPLFNDERYGGDRILKGTTFSKYKQFIENSFRLMPRHALHARELGFVHPTMRREMHFESPLPDDFRTLLDRWDNYTAHRDTFDCEE